MFVRQKTVNGHEYNYLVRNVRENGKVRQEVVCYLGKYSSVKEALDALTVRAERARQIAAGILAAAEAARGYWRARHWQTRRAWPGQYAKVIQRAERLEARIERLRGCGA